MISGLANKAILITGGTGSFGQAYIRDLLVREPKVKRVVVFSRDEFKQFEMKSRPPFDNKKIRYFVGDVRDRKRLYRAFDGIDIVIHAAALKQIPSCEYNPFEAVKTNIGGAQNVIDAAIDRKVAKVVALSTDKACAPINLYGATKLCADKLFIAGNSYVGRKKTKFAVVRYGNVAGSRGSAIPYFTTLLKKRAKFLPITDKRMTRFWLRQDQAVKLVNIALETMSGGELYVMRIPSMKIVDLARAMSPKLPIKIIGKRPGEKVHEMLISVDDAANTLEFKEYFVIQPQLNYWKNKNHKLGKRVRSDFEYNSGNNDQWLTEKQIRKMVNDLEKEGDESNLPLRETEY